jgi:hypothetical protein
LNFRLLERLDDDSPNVRTLHNLGIYNSQIQCPSPPNKTTQVDPSLARELARQCDDKDETKRLWLMIARNAAGNGATSHDGKDVVSRVVMVLKECGPEILSIEDVSDEFNVASSHYYLRIYHAGF